MTADEARVVDAAQPFGTRITWRNGVATAALSGALDLATASVLKERLGLLEQVGPRAIVLDLRELTFIDSTGVHAFLQARERADSTGYRLILSGANELTLRLFELTGTEFLLDDQGAGDLLEPSSGVQPPG